MKLRNLIDPLASPTVYGCGSVPMARAGRNGDSRKSVQREARFQVGSKVSARLGGWLTWHDAIVIGVQTMLPGIGVAYDVQYDDDRVIERQLDASLVRARGPRSGARRRHTTTTTNATNATSNRRQPPHNHSVDADATRRAPSPPPLPQWPAAATSMGSTTAPRQTSPTPHRSQSQQAQRQRQQHHHHHHHRPHTSSPLSASHPRSRSRMSSPTSSLGPQAIAAPGGRSSVPPALRTARSVDSDLSASGADDRASVGEGEGDEAELFRVLRGAGPATTALGADRRHRTLPNPRAMPPRRQRTRTRTRQRARQRVGARRHKSGAVVRQPPWNPSTTVAYPPTPHLSSPTSRSQSPFSSHRHPGAPSPSPPPPLLPTASGADASSAFGGGGATAAAAQYPDSSQSQPLSLSSRRYAGVRSRLHHSTASTRRKRAGTETQLARAHQASLRRRGLTPPPPPPSHHHGHGHSQGGRDRDHAKGLSGRVLKRGTKVEAQFGGWTDWYVGLAATRCTSLCACCAVCLSVCHAVCLGSLAGTPVQACHG